MLDFTGKTIVQKYIFPSENIVLTLSINSYTSNREKINLTFSHRKWHP